MDNRASMGRVLYGYDEFLQRVVRTYGHSGQAMSVYDGFGNLAVACSTVGLPPGGTRCGTVERMGSAW